MKLIGIQDDVAVKCVLIGEFRYRCSYTADRQGRLLCFILSVNRIAELNYYRVMKKSPCIFFDLCSKQDNTLFILNNVAVSH